MTLPTFQVEALQARYDMVTSNPSDIRDHIPTMVQAVRDLNAKKIIEIGVRYGVSTIAWLHALQPGTGTGGHLWAVDVSFPVAAPGTDVNLLDSQGGLTVLPHWNFILGNGCYPEVQAMLPDEVDLVFLDSNHVYDETLVELELFKRKVRDGGRILLHDTNIEDTGNRGDRTKVPYPVRTAVEEFCEKHGRKYEFLDIGCGLGTIYL